MGRLNGFLLVPLLMLSMRRVRSISANVIARQFHKTSVVCTNYVPIGSHRDTPDNTIETYFDFTRDNYKRVF